MQVEQDGRPADHRRDVGGAAERGHRRIPTVLVLLLATVGLAAWWWLETDRPGPDWLTGPPPGLELPTDGEVAAHHLDDGTPVFISHLDGEVTVLDARLPGPGPEADGRLRRLVGYCPSSGGFEEPAHGSMFGRDGRWNGGPAPGSLAIHPHRQVDERAVVTDGPVERDRPGRSTTTTRPQPTGPNCTDSPQRTLQVHRPDDPASLTDIEEGTWRWVDLRFEPTDAVGGNGADEADGSDVTDNANRTDRHLRACDDQGCDGSFRLTSPWTPEPGPALVRRDAADELEVLLPVDPTPAG